MQAEWQHMMHGTPLHVWRCTHACCRQQHLRFRGQCYCILRLNALLNTTVPLSLRQAGGQWGGVAGVHAFLALNVSRITERAERRAKSLAADRWPDKNRAAPKTTSSISGQLISGRANAEMCIKCIASCTSRLHEQGGVRGQQCIHARTAHSCTALVCSMVESPPRLTVGLQQQKTFTSYVKSCRSTSPQPGFIATAERQRVSCAVGIIYF